MAIDLSGNIDRFEGGDLRQFTYIDTVSIPGSVAFAIYDPSGLLLQPVAVQSGITVTASGNDLSKGLHYIFWQLPNSRGFYTAEWKAYGSGTAQSSLYVTARLTFEIYKTEPVSFYSYGDKGNVLRVARQLIGRGDLTEWDVRPHMQAAKSFIDARLGGVTTVPLASPNDYIKQGEEVIAVYTLYGQFGGSEKNEIPPSYAKLRDDFIGYLDKVAEGDILLDGTIDGSPVTGTAIDFFTGGVVGGAKPTFGRSAWEDQVVDQDILDKESDDRD